MVATIRAGLDRQVDKGKLAAEERDEIMGRVSATDHLGHLADCDLVIESVVEHLATKQELFRELEQVVKADGILATNTSTLPVVELAMVTQRPDQVCGIHFFNPAPVMALLREAETPDPSALSPTTTLPPQGIDLRGHIANIELDLIRAALAQTGGVVAHAAPLLGLRRTTLVEKLRKYGIERDTMELAEL